MNVASFIFVATSGRSGSGSLARILQAGENIHVEHEPEPVMYNDLSESQYDKQTYYREIFTKYKLPEIIKSSSGYRHYAETNHQFIKNFADLAISTFKEKTRVIHLYRDPVSVATSFYKIDSIPGKTERGKLYLLDPMADGNMLEMRKEFETPEFDDDLCRCLWYWYETEARIRCFKKRYPDIVLHKIETNQLNDYESVCNLLSNLDIDFSADTLKKITGTRTNLKESNKKKLVDINQAIAMNNQLRSYLEKKFGTDFYC